MQIKKQLSRLSVLAVTAVAFTFAGCEGQAPVSQNSDTRDTGQLAASDVSTETVLDNGPLSEEEVNAITAPEEKIQIAEKDLKILKSKSGVSLQKRFVSRWYVPLGAYGWAYVGDNLHGRSWLYFPRYAMNRSTIVTMDWESTGFLEGGAKFSPHGVQFNKPVTVWISYKDADLGDINEEDLRIWYFNEDAGMWEVIGDVVDIKHKMVGGLLHHFSRYAIGTE
ncbi:hypothetical protein IH970_12300 [candidate division KSB1 bacterium]|nr:hypothetical protein [candidate division KSB1 bacterium]